MDDTDMTYRTLDIDIDKDGIAVVSIDVPDQSMNVWNRDLMADFDSFTDTFIADDSITGAVIVSGKESGFMAGADLRMLQGTRTASVAEAFESCFALNAMFRKLETGGQPVTKLLKGQAHAKPVVAAVNGLALGGGLELVLSCHHRIVADDPEISLGLPEVQVGLLPGAGGTQRLSRLAGLQQAAMMATRGKPIDPQSAKNAGIIQEVVPGDALVTAAKKWIADNPKTAQPWDRSGFRFPGGGGAMDPRSVRFFIGANAMGQKEAQHNYPAIEAILSCLYEGSILPFDTAIRVESKYFTKLLTGSVAQNMIRTLFVSKQAAEKGEARPENIPANRIRKIGILGAGMMGAGIAYVAAKSGVDVLLLDRDMESAQKGRQYSEGLVQKGISRGKISKEEGDALLSRIVSSTDYAALSGAGLVIEAVFEDPAIKAGVIEKTEAVIGSDAILASNTSTLPISGLARHSQRPGQFIGIHFFSPVDRMPLVEIIPGEKTGDAALAMALDFVRKIKKTPVVVKDVRGFYANRVVLPYIDEAVLMVTEGVRPALVENASRMLGMPVGPLALCDETSQELGLRIATAEAAQTGVNPAGQPVYNLLELFVNTLGRKGRKSGGGFYEYPAAGEKHLWKDLQEHFPLAEKQPDVADVMDRLLYVQLVRAADCYATGIVSSPRSADLGAIFGWGFAPWTGGPMSYIDTIGAGNFVRKAESLAGRYGRRFSPPEKFREMADSGLTLYPPG